MMDRTKAMRKKMRSQSVQFDTALHSESWMREGDNASDLGRFDEALTCYEEAVKSDLGNGSAWRRLSIGLYRLERYPEAEGAARQGLAATGDLALHWHAALAQHEQGKIVEALRNLELYRAYCGTKASIVDGTHATLLHDLGRYEEAIPYIERAWRNERSAWNVFTLARIYLNAGQTTKSLRVLRRAIKKFNDDIDIRRLYVWVLIKHGDYEQAEAEARKLLKLAPEDLYGMRYLIHSTMLTGDAARAVELAEEFKSLFPEHDLDYFYGLALRRLGRFSDAIAALESIDPHAEDLPKWLYERGLCFVGLVRFEDARQVRIELSDVNEQLAEELEQAIQENDAPR